MPGKQETTAFIRSTFRSVWSLELLCFLRKNPQRTWSQAEMVSALRGSDLLVAQSVSALAAAGLIVVEKDGSAQYRPASPGLGDLAAAAEALYASSPDKVRRLIVSSASDGVTAFADAFRVWRDKP
jgi:hypothetical protein